MTLNTSSCNNFRGNLQLKHPEDSVKPARHHGCFDNQVASPYSRSLTTYDMCNHENALTFQISHKSVWTVPYG
ncbi:hypothetical protein V6N11_052060 [Hibiscus sabdariffa]|uniref:Uncharacterized protein n=1 Tax=Hibiscus sabdariffa TaxID=183260 RepID=A0ABR2U9C6_9ROSI